MRSATSVKKKETRAGNSYQKNLPKNKFINLNSPTHGIWNTCDSPVKKTKEFVQGTPIIRTRQNSLINLSWTELLSPTKFEPDVTYHFQKNQRNSHRTPIITNHPKKTLKNVSWTKLRPPTKFEWPATLSFREEAQRNKQTHPQRINKDLPFWGKKKHHLTLL